MLGTIVGGAFLISALISFVTIPLGLFLSIVFFILLLCVKNKPKVYKLFLPIISFIFLPTALVAAFMVFSVLPDRVDFYELNDQVFFWGTALIFTPLLLNTLMLLGWVFCREVLSKSYYLLWCVLFFVSAGLGIFVLITSQFS